MLFVLRLLPSYKKWQQRATYILFFLNFAASLVGLISFGLSCTPFEANWNEVPGSRCYSKNLIAITNRVNSGK